MSSNITVKALAEELSMPADTLIEFMNAEGLGAESETTPVEPDSAELIRDHFANRKTAAVAAPPAEDEAPRGRGGRQRKGKRDRRGRDQAGEQPKAAPPAPGKEIHVRPPIVVRDLAAAMDVKPNELIHDLMGMNVFASINHQLDLAVADTIARKRGFALVAEKRAKPGGGGGKEEDSVSPEDIVFDDAEVATRPPVIAFLGHVDHGKTSLQDKLRDTNITAGEAGGITQHIGASCIEWKGHKLTFIDTPGHEAFTAMRARGADTTDIVVLVVAADDGFMPQTIEALNHARAAKVPIVIAINKMDLPAANPDRILTQMQQNELSPEDWGGDVGVVRVSAHTGEGLDDLLERLMLEAEMLELKANPELPGRAIVMESQLEPGLGPTVNALVKNGTITHGDIIICGQEYGKVKALIDSHGKRIKEAGPSTPVKIVGLSGTVEGGTILAACKDDKEARRIAGDRAMEEREKSLSHTRKASLEDLFRQIEDEARKAIKLVVKSDVRGTGEAIVESLGKLSGDKITVDVIHTGVGPISENDVLLAAASDAIVIGFHVRVNPGVNGIAKKEGVDIRLYSVIYELVEEVRAAMTGMLDPDVREESLGQAKILQIFQLSRVGKICGCGVSKGVVRVGAKARVFRGTELIYNGSIQNLKRFQDDVKEVRQGLECGIRLDNFTDFEVDDVIEVYEYISTPASL